MLANIFSGGLDLFALVAPISIAAANIVFAPLFALWLLGGRKTLGRWPPVWGWPEKVFVLYLVVSFLSAFAGIDPRHSLKEIWHKDFYIILAVWLIALVPDREKNARLINIFMVAGVFTAVFGLVQLAMGINQNDKSDGIFIYLPHAFALWPRPILNLMSLLDGRVMGTRGHPLAYAECLLFNWSFAVCFLLRTQGKEWLKWMVATAIIGAALLASLSRGPWIAGAVILVMAVFTTSSKRSWIVVGVGFGFLAVLASIPTLRDRAVSILDRTHHSNQERVHMWHAGMQLWKSHPLLGIGPGNVKQVSTSFQTLDERQYGAWGHLHSIYVNFLAERGALGLLTFVLFIGALCRELWDAFRRSRQKVWDAAVYQSALLGIVGFLIGGLTETSYNTAVVKIMLYFVVGLALALSRHEQT